MYTEYIYEAPSADVITNDILFKYFTRRQHVAIMREENYIL
jgi:hypothetical protein